MQRETVKELLEEISALLPANINQEIADEAEVSTGWVSEVRNAKKKSKPTALVIAKMAKEKGLKLAELGERLASQLAEE